MLCFFSRILDFDFIFKFKPLKLVWSNHLNEETAIHEKRHLYMVEIGPYPQFLLDLHFWSVTDQNRLLVHPYLWLQIIIVYLTNF
jgi:hypothetical protein